MAEIIEDTIDFKALEKELEIAIEKDQRYWRENDAKFVAVNQRVATYDEFRDIVKAAHLKPLDKADQLAESRQKGCIWNSLASKKKSLSESNDIKHSVNKMDQVQKELGGGETNMHACCQFVRQLRAKTTPDERYRLMRSTGPEELGLVFRSEIPVGVFGELLEAILGFPQTTADIVTATQILEVFTHTKRFNLSLEFLTSAEKTTCREILDKLSESLRDRQQDLAEQGVTEWTVTTLRSKYKI